MLLIVMVITTPVLVGRNATEVKKKCECTGVP